MQHLNGDFTAARARLHSARHVLIVTHVSPDGDAIGSMCGLGLSLRALGNKVTMACDDPVPEIYRFIPGSGEVIGELPQPSPGDLFITVDCADMHRAGKVARAAGRSPDFNFDHHVTNPRFAEFNFIDPDSAATAEVLFELCEPLGLPLTKEVAECWLAGLVTDTLGFRTSSVTGRTLTTAQGLMATGAALSTISNLALHRRSFAAARLWGAGLSRARLEKGLVWTSITLADKGEVGYRGLGDADLVNVLTTIYEARVSAVFVERPDNKVKISLRANADLDVSLVAQAFGGGGHSAAAGAEVKGTLAEVETQVLAALRAAIPNL